MWIFWFIAILFLVAQGHQVATDSWSVGNLIFGGTIATVAIAGWFFFRHQRKLEFEQVAELSRLRGELARGEILYRGVPLNRFDQVRFFQVTISFVLVTSTIRSRCVLPGESAKALHLSCILITLMFGWWAFPWGPIHTLGSLGHRAVRLDSDSVAAGLFALAQHLDAEEQKA